MFQLNSWIPLVGNSSKLAVRNDWITPVPLWKGRSGRSRNRSRSHSAPHPYLRRRIWDPDIQPLEPMLLPKLRIGFADFPWLHSPH